jgi:hypothetical protein
LDAILREIKNAGGINKQQNKIKIMQTEIYKVEEVSGEMDNMVADSNAIDLIGELGLEGQKKLINTETATRIAFRKMTQVENDVFSILFPEKSHVTEFDSEIIPVRVLEALRDAVATKQFVSYEIWHVRTRKEDPILVGVVGKADPQTWNKNYIQVSARFLIARWGEALLPFPQLCDAAKKLWMMGESKKHKDSINEAKHKLETLAEEAEIKFSTI